MVLLRATSYFTGWHSPIDKATEIWMQIDTIISCICLTLFLPNTNRLYGLLCCCCNKTSSKAMKYAVKRRTMTHFNHAYNRL